MVSRETPSFDAECSVCTVDLAELMDSADSESCTVYPEVALVRELDRIADQWGWEESQGRGRVIQILNWLVIKLVEDHGSTVAGNNIQSLARTRINRRSVPRVAVRFHINSCLDSILRELAIRWEWIGNKPSKRFGPLLELSCWAGLRLEREMGDKFSDEAERVTRDLYHSFSKYSNEVEILLRQIESS